MFLEQRVGRIEERLGELESHSGSNEELELRLTELGEMDLQLRNEAAQLQQRLAQIEALSLAAKLEQIHDLLHDAANRLGTAESQHSRQVEINSSHSERLLAIEQALDEMGAPEDVDQRVQSLETALQDLQRQALEIRERLEALDHLSLSDRIRQLEDSVGGFHAFRLESQQLVELLQNDLAAQADRDDQLFELLGKLEERISGLDVKLLQERMNEAETAMAGFRAVVKEVRQRFDQTDHRLGDLGQRCSDLEERSVAMEESLAAVEPLQAQVRSLEEQLLDLDLQPVQRRLHDMEARIEGLGFDPGPLLDRLGSVETSADVLAQQFETFPAFAENAQKQLTRLGQQSADAAGQLENHAGRIAACESFQSKLPEQLKSLEQRLAAGAETSKQMKELLDKVKELEIDNRDLRDRLRTLKVSGGASGSSPDWFGRILGTAGLAAALIVGWLMMRPQPVLTAQRFVLRGSDGKIYAQLDSKDARALLEMNDNTGRPQLVLGASPDGGVIRMADSTGVNRMLLGLDATGNPGLTFADSRGTSRVELGVADMSYVSLRDVHGDRRVVLSASNQGPRVVLLRPSEQPHVVVGSGALGDGVSIYDQQKRLRAGMGITSDGAAVNLFDESEHRRVVVSANQAGPALAFLGDNDQHRTTIGMSANGESILNLHDSSGAQRIVLHVSESDAKVNVLDAEKNVVFATP